MKTIIAVLAFATLFVVSLWAAAATLAQIEPATVPAVALAGCVKCPNGAPDCKGDGFGCISCNYNGDNDDHECGSITY
ncbi:MAG: hypothetical protein ACRD1C_12815 [Terriglobales bacterium]